MGMKIELNGHWKGFKDCPKVMKLRIGIHGHGESSNDYYKHFSRLKL